MEKYDFDNFLNWDKKKVSQFLIWDFIQNMEAMNCHNAEQFFFNSFRASARKYKKLKPIIDSTDNMYNAIYSFRKPNHRANSNKKILFNVGAKYPSIVLASRKKYLIEMVVKGAEDRVFAYKNFVKYTSFTDLNQYVFDYFLQKDDNHLYRLINIIKERINKINPDHIILTNDHLPIERAIVLVGKKLKIPTIIVQHGAFTPRSLLSDGKFADYVFVWGQYFKDLYTEKNGRKPGKIHILGYPYLIKKNEVNNKKDSDYIVYYLGQNDERYNKKLFDIKFKNVIKVNNICKELGVKFIYRPHPGDDIKMLKKQFVGIKISSKNEKLSKIFKKGDIFISSTSTALVEAAMRSKISLQLMVCPSKSTNFEELKVCNKSFTTSKELKDYLIKIVNLQNLNEFKIKFNTDYVNLSYNPGKRFSEILSEIERKMM